MASVYIHDGFPNSIFLGGGVFVDIWPPEVVAHVFV